MALLSYLLAEKYSIVCMYHIFFIHSSMSVRLLCFHVLAIVTSAAMHIGVHVSFWILVLSGYMPRSRISGSHDNSSFSFLRKLHVVFCSSYTSLCSYQQCRRVPFSPHPLQYSLLVSFLMMAILTSVRYHCEMVLVLLCVYLIISDAEHLFICPFTTCLSSLGKCLVRSFFNWVVCFLLLSYKSCLYILETKFCQSHHLQMFSHIL